MSRRRKKKKNGREGGREGRREGGSRTCKHADVLEGYLLLLSSGSDLAEDCHEEGKKGEREEEVRGRVGGREEGRKGGRNIPVKRSFSSCSTSSELGNTRMNCCFSPPPPPPPPPAAASAVAETFLYLRV